MYRNSPLSIRCLLFLGYVLSFHNHLLHAQHSWSVQFPNLGTFSSPRVTDLNGYGMGDVVLGAGREEFQKCDSAVLALDGNTGKILWRSSIVKERTERRSLMNDAATPTPVTDGKNVFAFFSDFGAGDFRGYAVEVCAHDRRAHLRVDRSFLGVRRSSEQEERKEPHRPVVHDSRSAGPGGY